MSSLFVHLPEIACWIEREYDNARTREDVIELVYKWLDRAEKCTNTIIEQCYNLCAQYLYSEITKRIYATKQFQSY